MPPWRASLPPLRQTRQQPPLDARLVEPDTIGGMAVCPWALLDLAHFCEKFRTHGGPAPCPTAPLLHPPAPEADAVAQRTPLAGPVADAPGGTPAPARPDADRPPRRQRRGGDT